MPELPEVETVRRGLEPVLVGQSIARVEQRRANLRYPFPDQFAARLQGQIITAVERRAKYLLIKLSGGEALIIHLGMSGRLTVEHPNAPPTKIMGDFVYKTGAAAKHDHVVFTLGRNDVITYNDPRRFGFMLIANSADLNIHPLFAKLGVEPLESTLDGAYLIKCARDRSIDLKAFLLDQHVIAGLGNIYVCESLHRAGLSPKRQAQTLASRSKGSAQNATRLVDTIKAVLADALNAGGSSLRDYRQADGASGEFQRAFKVYGRAGAACLREGCGGTITRLVQAQRSTFYCANCQR